MAATVTSIPVDKKQPKKAVKPLAIKTRTTAKQQEIDEAASMQRFKDLMLKYGGKCSFDGFVE
jgi:hypothetical protein